MKKILIFVPIVMFCIPVFSQSTLDELNFAVSESKKGAAAAEKGDLEGAYYHVTNAFNGSSMPTNKKSSRSSSSHKTGVSISNAPRSQRPANSPNAGTLQISYDRARQEEIREERRQMLRERKERIERQKQEEARKFASQFASNTNAMSTAFINRVHDVSSESAYNAIKQSGNDFANAKNIGNQMINGRPQPTNNDILKGVQPIPEEEEIRDLDTLLDLLTTNDDLYDTFKPKEKVKVDLWVFRQSKIEDF